MIRLMVMAVWHLNGRKHLTDRGFLSWVYRRIVVPLEMRSIKRKLS